MRENQGNLSSLHKLTNTISNKVVGMTDHAGGAGCEFQTERYVVFHSLRSRSRGNSYKFHGVLVELKEGGTRRQEHETSRCQVARRAGRGYSRESGEQRGYDDPPAAPLYNCRKYDPSSSRIQQ